MSRPKTDIRGADDDDDDGRSVVQRDKKNSFNQTKINFSSIIHFSQ